MFDKSYKGPSCFSELLIWRFMSEWNGLEWWELEKSESIERWTDTLLVLVLGFVEVKQKYTTLLPAVSFKPGNTDYGSYAGFLRSNTFDMDKTKT